MGVVYGISRTWLTQTDAGISFSSPVQEGLVLNLDAGISTSYPGSGTTWTDLSASGNNGTLTNGPTYIGADGGSIVFDGSDDSVLLGSTSVISGDFTVEVWFEQTSYTPSALGNQRCLVGGNTFIGGADNCQFVIYDDGSIAIALNNAGIVLTPSTTGLITLNNWNQVIWTRTGSTITAYLNAVSRSSGTSSADVRVDRVGQIGTTGAQSKNFPGNISRVALYNRALSATEITRNYIALALRSGNPLIVTTGLVLNPGVPATRPKS